MVPSKTKGDTELARAVREQGLQAGNSWMTLMHCLGRLTLQNKQFCLVSTTPAFCCQLMQSRATLSIQLMTQLRDLVRESEGRGRSHCM